METTTQNKTGHSPASTHDWPSLLAQLENVTVRQAKHYTCRLPLFGRPHRHDDLFHFSYVRRGTSRIRIAGTVWQVGSDDMVFIRPEEEHESIADNSMDYELFEIRLAMASRAAGNAIPPFSPVIHVRNAAAFLPALERVVTAYLVDPFPQNWLVRVRLVEMMMMLAQEENPRLSAVTDVPTQDTAQRIQQAVDYIGMHYADPVRVKQLAGMAGWSTTHFATTFTRVMQVSPIEFLIRRRLHHARELLRNSTLPIKQIAEMCGFSSPQHFARIFTQREAVPPGQYRRQARRHGPGAPFPGGLSA